MKNFLLILCVIIFCIIIVALPLYLVVNFTCWVFNVPYHLSIMQAFALSLLANIINKLLFRKKEDK